MLQEKGPLDFTVSTVFMNCKPEAIAFQYADLFRLVQLIWLFNVSIFSGVF